MVSLALQDAYFLYLPQVWTIDSSWTLQNSSLVYLVMEFGLCLVWLDLLQTSQKSPANTLGVSVNPISSSIPLALFPGPLIVPFLSRTCRDVPNEAAPALPPGSMGFPGRPVSGLLVPSLSRVFFDGLEWPSCVKEYPSLLQSEKSASYQTLRMWVAGPHRRTPHLGPFVSSSEDSLHQPERASSSSVRPEGLRTPVGILVGSSVLRQHHHSNVCPSPASFIMGSSNVSADSLRRPIW